MQFAIMEAKDILKRRNIPSAIQQEFVFEILKRQADMLKQHQTNTITRFNLEKTGNLRRNRHIGVNKSGLFGGEIVHTFPIYMRFLDMKRIKRGGKSVSKKSYWTYNRLLHSRFNTIVWETQVKFTDEAIRRIAKDLNIVIPV